MFFIGWGWELVVWWLVFPERRCPDSGYIRSNTMVMGCVMPIVSCRGHLGCVWSYPQLRSDYLAFPKCVHLDISVESPRKCTDKLLSICRLIEKDAKFRNYNTDTCAV